MADGYRIKAQVLLSETGLFEAPHRQDLDKQRYDSLPVWERLAAPLVFYGLVQLLGRRCFAGSVPANLRLALFAILFAFVALTAQAAPLNDTGITTFGGATSNSLSVEPADYPGQDASYGRDAAAATGALTKIGGGRAGFDFTKLDANGNGLPASAASWACVRDNVTGLVWDAKTDDGDLRDKDNTYTWYNPDGSTNGGSAGTQNGGACAGGIACDTYSYAQAINSQSLCGYSDWRLPWDGELNSVVDYSIPYPGPTIDTDYFPNTISGNSSTFWSATPYANSSGFATIVLFYDGLGAGSLKPNAHHVRLVRGGQQDSGAESPVCGNGICESGESFATCSADCSPVFGGF